MEIDNEKEVSERFYDEFKDTVVDCGLNMNTTFDSKQVFSLAYGLYIRGFCSGIDYARKCIDDV